MLAPPLWIGLIAAAVAGLLAGGYVNWAVYSLAWNRRAISPWGAPHAKAPPRRRADRLPVWGWLGLRREAEIHGAGFWRRPMAVEALTALAWAALYWWEVGQQGLVQPQLEALTGGALPLQAPPGSTLAAFASHAVLVTLMIAASLIDVDEKTIPDGVTVPGTLLALLLAAALPMSLLPHVAERLAPPVAGVAVNLPPALAAQMKGAGVYVEPTTLAAPNPWPARLEGFPNRGSLMIGLACFAIWWIALTPRIMRWRRGLLFGLRVLTARAMRELLRPRSAMIGLAGFAGIIAVWYRGGDSWVGLLTALVGMADDLHLFHRAICRTGGWARPDDSPARRRHSVRPVPLSGHRRSDRLVGIVLERRPQWVPGRLRARVADPRGVGAGSRDAWSHAGDLAERQRGTFRSRGVGEIIPCPPGLPPSANLPLRPPSTCCGVGGTA
jgi:leader peptidase (prepilin peptidase) / N-methyltransferase